MPSSKYIVEAQQRAQKRAAAHVLRTKTAPSISGRIPRRNRRKIKARPPWDDSVAGRSLPRSAAVAAAATTTSTVPKASRIAPLLITDRADGSPVNTRTVRPVTGGKSESLTKSSVATSPIDTTRLDPSTSLRDREAEALEKLEKKLTELETIEDMIRLQIGDGESIFGEDVGEDEIPSTLLDHNENGDGDGASPSSFLPTTQSVSDIPPPLLNISLNESIETRLIRSCQAYQCRRRRIIEEPFQRTGLPAHAVIEEAVEAIIDDEIQRLRLEELEAST